MKVGDREEENRTKEVITANGNKQGEGTRTAMAWSIGGAGKEEEWIWPPKWVMCGNEIERNWWENQANEYGNLRFSVVKDFSDAVVLKEIFSFCL